MSERAYTVAEIDDLRRVLRERYMWGTCAPFEGSRISRSYQAAEMILEVEEQTRTAMLAGLTADDFRKADRERMKL